MASSPRPWLVAPHEPLEQLAENVWAVHGRLPGREFIDRRMHIIRTSTGDLWFHNAVPVDEATLAKVQTLGRPAVLLVPALSHTLDVHPFREKLGLAAYCPAPIAEKVRAILPIEGAYEALPRDERVRLHALDGVSSGEVIIEVRSPDGASAALVTCDAVLNLANTGGPVGWFMRLVKGSGGPRVGPFFRWKAVTDTKALGGSLRRLSDVQGLVVLAPSHGAVIRGGVREALLEAARFL